MDTTKNQTCPFKTAALAALEQVLPRVSNAQGSEQMKEIANGIASLMTHIRPGGLTMKEVVDALATVTPTMPLTVLKNAIASQYEIEVIRNGPLPRGPNAEKTAATEFLKRYGDDWRHDDATSQWLHRANGQWCRAGSSVLWHRISGFVSARSFKPWPTGGVNRVLSFVKNVPEIKVLAGHFDSEPRLQGTSDADTADRFGDLERLLERADPDAIIKAWLAVAEDEIVQNRHMVATVADLHKNYLQHHRMHELPYAINLQFKLMLECAGFMVEAKRRLIKGVKGFWVHGLGVDPAT